MTNLHISNPNQHGTQVMDGDKPVITAKGYLTYPHQRTHLCPGCGDGLGGRKVGLADDGHIVHAKCQYDYNADLAQRARAEQAAVEEAKRAELQAQHEANVARRGTSLAEYRESMRHTKINSTSEAWNEFVFFDRARRTIDAARKELDTWLVRVTGNNPANAFEWSGGAFAAAAKLSVYGRIEAFFERGLSHEEIIDIYNEEAMRRAGSTTHSTSPTSNLMEDEIRVAYANVSRRV